MKIYFQCGILLFVIKYLDALKTIYVIPSSAVISILISLPCRGVKFLSLEGCSQLTTEGLESVLLSWTGLKSLTVVSCNNVKDEAITPALSNLFAVLKEFKWRPDSKSVLAMGLSGSEMGRKGGRFFKRG